MNFSFILFFASSLLVIHTVAVIFQIDKWPISSYSMYSQNLFDKKIEVIKLIAVKSDGTYEVVPTAGNRFFYNAFKENSLGNPIKLERLVKIIAHEKKITKERGYIQLKVVKDFYKKKDNSYLLHRDLIFYVNF